MNPSTNIKFNFNRNKDPELIYRPKPVEFSLYQMCQFPNPLNKKYGVRRLRINEFFEIIDVKEKDYPKKKIDNLLPLALKHAKNKDIQIEVENLDQLKKFLELGFKNILLDNFNIKNLNKAVLINKKRAILEASGNITLKNVKKIALTGVNRISLGSLTKNIKAIDLSMKIETFKSL